MIHCCDCVEGMKALEDACIDLTVTSPPYDNLREYKGYTFNFEETAKQLYRVTKDGGVVVWVVGDATINGSETGTSFKQALYFKEIGFNLHDTMIWLKCGACNPSKTRYYNAFEYMFILSKGTPKFVNLIADKQNKYVGIKRSGTRREANSLLSQKEDYGIKNIGVRYNFWYQPQGYLISSLDLESFDHPATFPEQLANDHILSWSNKGDLVLDPFMGSGTTGKMAIINEREFIGFEIAEEYFKIAETRINNAKGQGKIDSWF